LLKALKIKIDFDQELIFWDEAFIPMKPIDNTKENMYIQDPKAVEDETQRVKTILEAKYEAADLNEIVKSCQHLNLEEQKNY
jgi:hypothetical protein